MSHELTEQIIFKQKNQSTQWKHPIPLTSVLKNENPYPFDALPKILQQVVNGVFCIKVRNFPRHAYNPLVL
jgi:hypothetical protein